MLTAWNRLFSFTPCPRFWAAVKRIIFLCWKLQDFSLPRGHILPYGDRTSLNQLTFKKKTRLSPPVSKVWKLPIKRSLSCSFFLSPTKSGSFSWLLIASGSVSRGESWTELRFRCFPPAWHVIPLWFWWRWASSSACALPVLASSFTPRTELSNYITCIH